jgi:hypothetical protein
MVSIRVSVAEYASRAGEMHARHARFICARREVVRRAAPLNLGLLSDPHRTWAGPSNAVGARVAATPNSHRVAPAVGVVRTFELLTAGLASLGAVKIALLPRSAPKQHRAATPRKKYHLSVDPQLMDNGYRCEDRTSSSKTADGDCRPKARMTVVG